MIRNMKCVDLYTIESILHFFGQQVPTYASKYGLTGTIELLPAYPSKVTKFMKPSIIVQELHISDNKIGMGNFIGQHEDVTGTYDVHGRWREYALQIAVIGQTLPMVEKLSSVVCDEILWRVRLAENPLYIPWIDFSDNNLPEVNNIKIIGDIDIMTVSVNENEDNMRLIQMHCGFVNHRLDLEQAMVDLSKPLKITQTIRL